MLRSSKSCTVQPLRDDMIEQATTPHASAGGCFDLIRFSPKSRVDRELQRLAAQSIIPVAGMLKISNFNLAPRFFKGTRALYNIEDVGKVKTLSTYGTLTRRMAKVCGETSIYGRS